MLCAHFKLNFDYVFNILVKYHAFSLFHHPRPQSYIFFWEYIKIYIANHQIRMISEAPCDTEDWNNGFWNFSFAITGKK